VSDQRPDTEPPARPAYGEYATPEEQRARIRQPDATWAIETGQAPDAVEAATPPAAGAQAAVAPAASGPKRGPLGDRITTWVLLALGAFNVLTTAPGLFVFDEQLDALLALFGVDAQVSDPAGVRTWGMIAAVVLIAGFLLTAMITLWWMRRGRIAFWIPLVGFLVTTIAMSACINVPLMGDPAFQQFTDRILGFSVGG
jgi:hypothetical protein